jgi:hypothetical protein
VQHPPRDPGYRPRDPESTALHKAVRGHLETFLEELRALPWCYRLLLARRPPLLSLALQLFLRSLFSWQRRQARARGIRGRAGAVTFVQRFSSALRLNVHFHVLVPDGVFDVEGTFHAPLTAASPTR